MGLRLWFSLPEFDPVQMWSGDRKEKLEKSGKTVWKESSAEHMWKTLVATISALCDFFYKQIPSMKHLTTP